MANMSYCRFRNTAADLKDCLEALEDIDFDLDGLESEEEKRAAERLIERCREIVEGAGL